MPFSIGILIIQYTRYFPFFKTVNTLFCMALQIHSFFGILSLTLIMSDSESHVHVFAIRCLLFQELFIIITQPIN